MKTKTVTIFEFDDLDDKAKEKARQWWRDGEAQDFGSDPWMLEQYETAARLLGIELDNRNVELHGGMLRIDSNIWWSLHAPGSGASFEGKLAIDRRPN